MCLRLQRLKNKGQDVNGGQCLKTINGRFVFSEKDQKRVWKEHMEKQLKKCMQSKD